MAANTLWCHVACSSHTVTSNVCALLKVSRSGRTIPRLPSVKTFSTSGAVRLSCCPKLLTQDRRGTSKNGIDLQLRQQTFPTQAPHGRTFSNGWCSAVGEGLSNPSRSLLSVIKAHRCGSVRMKHSGKGNNEVPVVFVSKAPIPAKRSVKKQPSESKTSPPAPVIARSRTKKPTRLGMQEKKEIPDAWLCTAFSTAEEYHLEHLSLDLQSQGNFLPIAMPQDAQDVLLMEVTSLDADTGNEPSQMFFFREGSVVFWNVPDKILKKVLRIVSKHEFKPYEVALVTWENEYINFSYGSQQTKVTDDAIILDQNADTEMITLEKFAFSNAMALSVKLGIWEASVDKFTSSLESFPESLKSGQRLMMSRVEVMRKTGELFSLRHQINLSSDLLISPDFYWDRDDLDELYNKTCQFYSIGRRTKVTNEKLNHCSELVELMRTHLSERHSLKLEWMIILLIAVEVMFEVIHYMEKYYERRDQVVPVETSTATAGRR